MFVGSKFHGDDNKALMMGQHATYSAVISHLVNDAIDYYLEAEKATRIKTEIGNHIREIKKMEWQRVSFDHRVIQEAHDIIAANYRFIKKHEQMPLFPDSPRDFSDKETRGEWLDYARREIRTIIKNPFFLHSCLIAVLLANSKEGKTGEMGMCFYLCRRYMPMVREMENQELAIIYPIDKCTNWKEKTLFCIECNRESNRLDWEHNQKGCEQLSDLECPHCGCRQTCAPFPHYLGKRKPFFNRIPFYLRKMKPFFNRW